MSQTTGQVWVAASAFAASDDVLRTVGREHHLIFMLFPQMVHRVAMLAKTPPRPGGEGENLSISLSYVVNDSPTAIEACPSGRLMA